MISEPRRARRRGSPVARGYNDPWSLSRRNAVTAWVTDVVVIARRSARERGYRSVRIAHADNKVQAR